MTRDEALEILGILSNVRNSEYVADQMMQDEVDRCIEIIRNEITEITFNEYWMG